MRVLMTADNLDRWGRYCRWLLPGGFILVVITMTYEVPGLLTAFAAMFLGATGVLVATTWREGQALYLLYSVFGLMSFAIYAIATYATVREQLEGVTYGIATTLDFTGFLLLLWRQVRMTLTAMVLNWRIDHRVRFW